MYHLSIEKLLDFRGERQCVIYSKRNEPRLSVVGAFFYKFYEFDVLTKC
nr:MAG TPA: hypothetical protein [Caudoviricetes sp.]